MCIAAHSVEPIVGYISKSVTLVPRDTATNYTAW